MEELLARKLLQFGYSLPPYFLALILLVFIAVVFHFEEARLRLITTTASLQQFDDLTVPERAAIARAAFQLRLR